MWAGLEAVERGNSRARPFLKWAGGKAQLLGELVSRLPRKVKSYHEPFVGGGALFFHLLPTQAFLSDTNSELIGVYLAIRDNVELLIENLRKHRYDEEYYYTLRDVDRTPAYASWSNVERAARFIYLNKSCYNGLYRVNRKGHFNVPFGRYTAPTILDENNLRACSRALQSASIEQASFGDCTVKAERGDFVYFDPPYAPLSATSNFSAYTKEGFDATMQAALRDVCCELDKKGVSFMVSNSAAPLITDLYSEFHIEFVYAKRAINSKATSRGKIQEVIITNYSR